MKLSDKKMRAKRLDMENFINKLLPIERIAFRGGIGLPA